MSLDVAFLVRSYGESKSITSLRHLHSTVSDRADTFLSNLIIQSYSKCGSTEDSRRCFYSIARKNLVSWTLMIAAYGRNKQPEEALRLFWEMILEGLKPDRAALLEIIGICTQNGDLHNGTRIHSQIRGTHLEEDVFLATALINLYTRCGELQAAERTFACIRYPNNHSWNSIISAYAKNGEPLKAVKAFESMNSEPDRFSFLSVLGACGILQDAVRCSEIHSQIVSRGLESDFLLATQLITSYARCGRLEDAYAVFKRQVKWNDTVGWNSMIAGYSQAGNHATEAIGLYYKLNQEGVQPDGATFVSVLDACAQLCLVSAVISIHDRIVASGVHESPALQTSLIVAFGTCKKADRSAGVFERSITQRRSVSCWNAMIEVYTESECGTRAMELFHRMDLEGIKQNEITFINALAACSRRSEVESIHARVSTNTGDLKLRTALITSYGKLGCLEKAREVLKETHSKDLVAWNAMLTCYSQHGSFSQVYELFERMISSRVEPDSVTYIGLLGVCSDLFYGREIHERIIATQALNTQQLINLSTALITMYGKCGSLNEAQKVFNSMKEKNLFTWNSLLSAYSKNLKQCAAAEALDVARHMHLEGIKPNSVTFVSILEACSHGGLIEEGCRSFVEMSTEFDVLASVEHYGCLIDLLGRLGWLVEAQNVAANEASRSDFVSWMSLFGACELHMDPSRAKQVALKCKQILQTKSVYNRFAAGAFDLI